MFVILPAPLNCYRLVSSAPHYIQLLMVKLTALSLLHFFIGIHTGSVYRNPELATKGFADANQNGSVIALKTFYPLETCCDALQYERIILILRDPEEAAMSLFTLEKMKADQKGVIDRMKINPQGEFIE